MTPSESHSQPSRHSWPASLALHLVPGLQIALVYYWAGIPLAASAGWPSIAGLFLAVLLVLIPWMLGLLLYLGKQRNGRLSLDGIVLNRTKVPARRLLLYGTGLFVWAVLVAVGGSAVDDLLFENLFAWLPPDFLEVGFDPSVEGMATFHIATLINLLIFGIAAPVVEELYFRGFLLPRMPAEGLAAPLTNSVLFAVYHMWSPWMAVSRAFLVFPMVWLVWKKESVQISIWVHSALNCFGIILTWVGFVLAA